MPRRPRLDEPGSWHHVINRAIAKRPYFETRSDQRYFLAQLAREVRRGRLEVHAFCLLTTHFHLLVRSPIGELSNAMRRVQNTYSRYFNRIRRRDGPLIRARYYSKRVRNDRYRHAVVRYIDANAVKAGLVSNAADHEFTSARYYVRGQRPPWLSGDWVEARAMAITGDQGFQAATYLRAFGPKKGQELDVVIELVEARMRSGSDIDPIDDLIGRTPAQVQLWMKEKAALADGHRLGLPVCGPSSVTRAIAQHVAAEGDWIVCTDRNSWSAASVAKVGLLRDLSAMTFDRIGRVTELGPWAVRRRIELHRNHMREDGEYSERVGRVAHSALDMHG